MAERYERTGLPAISARENAILYLANIYDVDMETLDKCIHILEDAGYSASGLEPCKP